MGVVASGWSERAACSRVTHCDTGVGEVSGEKGVRREFERERDKEGQRGGRKHPIEGMIDSKRETDYILREE